MSLPRDVVIGASGPSLTVADRSRVPAASHIVRVNNFFFEDQYNLGRRVDTVFFSGDPYALRFYLATLRKVIESGMYDVHGTVSHHPAAARLRPPKPFEWYRTRTPAITTLIEDARADRGVSPTSGVMAMLWAWEHGAERLFVSGFDMYASADKYAFEVPPQLARLLGARCEPTGYDTSLHTRDLDLAVIDAIRARGLEIFDLAGGSSKSPFDRAPLLAPDDHMGEPDTKISHVDDWSRRSGLWTVDTLVLLRRVRRATDQVRRRFGRAD